MSDEVMTTEEFNYLKDMQPAAVLAAVKSKMISNPLFIKIIEKLIADKLYTGLQLNPLLLKDYGGKSPTDILVDSVAATLYSSVVGNDGARYIGLDATANPALSTATNVHEAIIAIANAVTALGGQIIVTKTTDP